MLPPFATHEVFNQAPPFAPRNLFTDDAALQEAVQRDGAAAALKQLERFGAKAGSAEAFELGRLANEYVPQLRTFDARGARLDLVEYHPAYHALMALSMAEGLHASPWERLAAAGKRAPGAAVARSAGCYLAAQMEAGHCCPITMTNAAVATLLLEPGLATAWLPKILARQYDKSFRPMSEKTSVTIGMGMTEKQGGTDVRANTTRAESVGAGGPGNEYLITGHKWFMSAPMCDAFLVLAQAKGGLSCFLMPRFLPDDTVNAIHFQRLKDKLGNRSNASSEVEFAGAHAWLIGEEGRGVPSILEMVTWTRLDCAVSTAGLMRLAVANAVHHCHHRAAFQKQLIDQPLMTNVLADMALDVEAATALAFRLARSFDHPDDPAESAWRRLMTPVTKYWVCKIAPALAYESMECLGGNGYVEDGIAARLYREVPVNAIWEGSGNVMALDVLRVLRKEPDVAAQLIDGLGDAAEDNRFLKAHLAKVHSILGDARTLDSNARALVEGLALAAAGALLAEYAPPEVGDAFLATRLGGGWRQTYGQGLARADVKGIVGRVLPG